MNNSKKILENCTVAFGTSGARGLVSAFTPDVCASFAHAFVDVMKRIFQFDTVALAIDNRPSSYAIAQACSAALEQAGIKTVYYGIIPTPALAYKAMQDKEPCIMVTGSHIPFDRNGLKFYRPNGEISKEDEKAIVNANVNFEELSGLPELKVNTTAANEYIARYLELFEGEWLKGKRIGIYEHSSAGRDLYVTLFKKLGANVISLERSDEFVPIDTEAVSEQDKEKAHNWSKEFGLDFIFSTDGDGDRPLVADEHGKWLRGDILGLLCADVLGIEALVIPVSCNTAVELSNKFKHIERTKIGSPYVIAEFLSLTQKFNYVAGFEANGGFLLGSDIQVGSSLLKALPTRDALLPALMILKAAEESVISALLSELPSRFTNSDRIKDFPTEKSLEILKQGASQPDELIEKLFVDGVKVIHANTMDGLRLTLSNGDVVHFRPSGNAPELRCYVEADSNERAIQLVEQCLENIVYNEA